MDIESFHNFCLNLRGVSQEFPFDNRTLVYKVMGKMFALADVEEFDSVNLKCNPEKAIELRERYPAVVPGHHMHKKHWNTVIFDGSISDNLIKDWILESYFLVVSGLPKKIREEWARLPEQLNQ